MLVFISSSIIIHLTDANQTSTQKVANYRTSVHDLS